MMNRIVAALCLASVVLCGASAWAQSGGNPSGGSGDKPSWSDRISLYADFRGRIESFFYSDSDKVNRHRPRYRFRVGLKTKLSDNVSFNARLATGSSFNSSNQTLGSGDDFDPDGIFVDKAQLTVRPFGDTESGGDLALTIGKMSNPFKGGKQGKDLIIWDGDITPEGIAATWASEPAGRWGFDASLAYFILSEETAAKNVYLVGVQADNTIEASENVDVRIKGSFYRFDNLNSDFFSRARDGGDSGGNTPGLTMDFTPINFFDVRGSVGSSSSEKWPLTVWGQAMINTSATTIEDPMDALVVYDAQDKGYSAGLEVGSKKKSVSLGAGYYWVQADALPSMMIDSDLFDGATNGKGWALYGSRQVWKNTDLAFQLFVGDVLDEDLAAIQEQSLSKRTRFQGDIKIKF